MTCQPELPETPNRSSEHQHVYELKGTQIFYAECECGEKFNRGNGVVCGSRAKVQAALRAVS